MQWRREWHTTNAKSLEDEVCVVLLTSGGMGMGRLGDRFGLAFARVAAADKSLPQKFGQWLRTVKKIQVQEGKQGSHLVSLRDTGTETQKERFHGNRRSRRRARDEQGEGRTRSRSKRKQSKDRHNERALSSESRPLSCGSSLPPASPGLGYGPPGVHPGYGYPPPSFPVPAYGFHPGAATAPRPAAHMMSGAAPAASLMYPISSPAVPLGHGARPAVPIIHGSPPVMPVHHGAPVTYGVHGAPTFMRQHPSASVPRLSCMPDVGSPAVPLFSTAAVKVKEETDGMRAEETEIDFGGLDDRELAEQLRSRLGGVPEASEEAAEPAVKRSGVDVKVLQAKLEAIKATVKATEAKLVSIKASASSPLQQSVASDQFPPLPPPLPWNLHPDLPQLRLPAVPSPRPSQAPWLGKQNLQDDSATPAPQPDVQVVETKPSQPQPVTLPGASADHWQRNPAEDPCRCKVIRPLMEPAAAAFQLLGPAEPVVVVEDSAGIVQVEPNQIVKPIKIGIHEMLQEMQSMAGSANFGHLFSHVEDNVDKLVAFLVQLHNRGAISVDTARFRPLARDLGMELR